MNTKRSYFDASRWALLISIALMVGCGQRGDLYLPDKPAEEDGPEASLAVTRDAALVERPGR